MFIRITKAEARKLFAQGDKVIYLCPCKMRPGFPFNMALGVTGKEYLENAERNKEGSDLWKGTLEETAWDLMYNNWYFYNCLDNETGYYAHYYVER